MKKFTRILTIALVLVMLCSLLPMGAMAASVPAIGIGFMTATDKIVDALNYGYVNWAKPLDAEDGKTFAPDKLTSDATTGELYDLRGMYVIPDLSTMTAKDRDAWIKNFNEALVSNGVTSVKIPAYPETNANGEQDAWNAKWMTIIVSYAPHQHKLSRWYTDTTNHWKQCTVCKENFLMMDWHHDYDNDKVCDFCGDEILYYDITIEEVEGAKLVELEGDTDMTAAYRDDLFVEFEAEDGYRLLGVRFYKVRDDGTESELTRQVITRYEVYGVEMPSFNIRIVPEVVKAD